MIKIPQVSSLFEARQFLRLYRVSIRENGRNADGFMAYRLSLSDWAHADHEIVENLQDAITVGISMRINRERGI